MKFVFNIIGLDYFINNEINLNIFVMIIFINNEININTLYTTISHSKLKDRLKVVQLWFIKKDCQHIHKYIVLQILYCKKNHFDSTKTFSKTNIIIMLESLIDNIFVMFGRTVFQQTVGIHMGTNMYSPSHQPVPLFIWGRLHTGTFEEKLKETSPILSLSRSAI